MTGLPTLPEFDAPPVVEVVLGVAFEPSYALSNIELVELWRDLFKAQFPYAAERPPYDAPRETFKIPIPKAQLVTHIGPLPTRLWLTSSDKTDLIQVQHDWFARNWRKVEVDGIYPRYEDHIRPAFAHDFSAFADYAKERGHNLRFTQCEVTYINRIETNGVWQDYRDLPALFSLFSDLPSELMSFDSLAFRGSSLIHPPHSERLGRLHIEINSASDSDSDPMVMLNLTARGTPVRGQDMDAVMRFLDIGRELIVTTFLQITTAKAHREWGRTR